MNSMKEIDVLKDLLEFKISNQKKYNNDLITIRNPELRDLLTTLRDDELRDIVRLQQKVERLKSNKTIISKILPTRHKM